MHASTAQFAGCRALAKTVVLPNGFEASYVSKEDAIFLYKEIYEDKGGYLKEGIALGAGNHQSVPLKWVLEI